MGNHGRKLTLIQNRFCEILSVHILFYYFILTNLSKISFKIPNSGL